MRFIIFLLVALSACIWSSNSRVALSAQKSTKPQVTSPAPRPKSKVAPSPSPTPRDPGKELAATVVISEPQLRADALRAFIKDFPTAAEVTRAKELLVSAIGELADTKLGSGEPEVAVELFKTAVKDAPKPSSEDLYSKVLLKFPLNLFARNQRAAAFDVAALIEENAGQDAKKLIGLATFFLQIEYGTEAIRLAEKAKVSAPELSLVHQTLGIATRLNFMPEKSIEAYRKAIELDPQSNTSRRSLADLLRASGNADEAERISRDLLDKTPDDRSARSILVLSLFDLGKTKEAESELQKALESNPDDARLLTSVSLWYSKKGDSVTALDYARKGQRANPAFIWAYIAEARALIQQKKPLEAEKSLLLGKRNGTFATLEYEIAKARFEAGLFREAAETLAQTFQLKEGVFSTYLGNRILADGKTIAELIKLEAQILAFEPDFEIESTTSASIEGLLGMLAAFDTDGKSDEKSALLSVERFVGGPDNMRTHRQLFAASRLLFNKLGVKRAIELSREAVSGIDSSLEVAAPSAAVMADEIYDSRIDALAQGSVIVVPDIPRATLLSIMRGRLEELAGWGLMMTGETSKAVTRFRRGLTVLPEKSVWWRSTLWRLGEALEAEGNKEEALASYIKAFSTEIADNDRYLYIENLYIDIKGQSDGLESLIGKRPEGLPPIRVKEKPSLTGVGLAEDVFTEKTDTVANIPCASEKFPTYFEIPAGGMYSGFFDIPSNIEIGTVSLRPSRETEIEASVEPSSSVRGRVWFSLRSIARVASEMKIVLSLPCGKKESVVKIVLN